jgi:hypothetical protein
MIRCIPLLGIISSLTCACVSSPDEQAATFEPILDGGADADAGAAARACGIEHARYALKTVSVEHVCARLLLDAASFRQGSNDFLVDLRAEDGTDAALLDVSAFMPAHGHGTSATKIEPTAAGYCVGSLPLVMPGRWELTLIVRADNQIEEIVVPVDVR